MSGTRDRSRERLVRVTVADDPASAELLRAALDAAGIRSFVKNVDALAYSGGGVGSYAIFVLEGDRESARAVIEDGRPGVMPDHAAHRRDGLLRRLTHRHRRRADDAGVDS